MTEIPDDVEMIARALNMRLHNAKTLGQRKLWIAEAILADRAEREAVSPAPQTHAIGLLEEALAALDSYADPTGYIDGYGEALEADAPIHPGLLAKATAEKIRAALATEGKA